MCYVTGFSPYGISWYEMRSKQDGVKHRMLNEFYSEEPKHYDTVKWIKTLRTTLYLSYLKIQFVPLSKHFSSRL